MSNAILYSFISKNILQFTLKKNDAFILLWLWSFYLLKKKKPVITNRLDDLVVTVRKLSSTSVT